MPGEGPTPDHILQTGFGFFASKTLLSAVELGVFTELDRNGPQTLDGLEESLGLHPRSSRDFLDALVALGFLDREEGTYRNTEETAAFLVEGKPSYVGGLLEMANDRLYHFWGDLTEALQDGMPTNELEDDQTHPFEEAIYQDDENLEQFVGAMTGLSMGVANALAHEFPWDRYESVADLGTSEGVVPKLVAEENDHLRAIGIDLPRVEPHFQSFAGASPAADRIEFQTADFFDGDSLPAADVYVLGHILHDWGADEKQEILDNVYDAVTDGGAVIIYGSMIDDDRRENGFGLMMSLNMLVETPNGFDYTHSECAEWLEAAGFTDPQVDELPGPESMVVARK